MATEITKTYQVSVTFKKIDGSSIVESEINIADMRTDIKQRITEATNVTRGDINALPGEVTET